MIRLSRLAAAMSLSSALLASPVVALDLKAMSEEDKTAFGAAVRDYLLEHPEVLMEAINTLEQRQMAEEATADKALVAELHDAIFQDGHSWVGGNPDGKTTVVEFVDYRCGYCRKVHQEVMDVVEADGDIRLILKEFPILGPDSEASSRFAIAVKQVAGDEAYIKAHDALMALRAPATPEALEGVAKEIGVDAAAVKAAMGSEDVTKVIAANHDLGQRMRIQGTPTFIVGDELLRGVPPQGLAAVVDAVRKGDEG